SPSAPLLNLPLVSSGLFFSPPSSTLLLPSCSFVITPATSELSPLSLHDALPIFGRPPLGKGQDHREPALAIDQGDHRALTLLAQDRKSTRLNSSHVSISYAVFCLKKKRNHL